MLKYTTFDPYDASLTFLVLHTGDHLIVESVQIIAIMMLTSGSHDAKIMPNLPKSGL